MWIKPHLLFPVALIIVVVMRWRDAARLLSAFLAGTLALASLSWATTGGALFIAWGRDLVAYGNTMDTRQPLLSSVAGIYLSYVGRPWSNYLAMACVGAWLLCAILLARHARRREVMPGSAEWWRVVAIVLVAWLLLTPYAHPADLVLVVVALPLILGQRLEGLADPLVRLALGALLTAPAADLLGFRPNYVFTYSVLVPLTLLLALRPWQSRSGAPVIRPRWRIYMLWGRTDACLNWALI